MKLAFVLPALFLVSMINCQQRSHYGNPFTGKCRNDEVQLGQNPGTCSRNCDTQECPQDFPKAGVVNVTPMCINKNIAGHKYCGLKCNEQSVCPQGARCYKLKNYFENEEVTSSRNRALQQRTTPVCLFVKVNELPFELELLEDN